MSNYLVPTTDEFIEEIAKAIARERFSNEIAAQTQSYAGVEVSAVKGFEEAVDKVFERLWNGSLPQDEHQKDLYRKDAAAAIRAINLKFFTLP